MKNFIAASTSTIYNGDYLDYLSEALTELFSETDEILFIPYARPGGISHDQYTEKAFEAFKKLNKKVVGIHTFKDPEKALKEANGIFTGGGNTFVLVSTLYKNQIMQPLEKSSLTELPIWAPVPEVIFVV